MDLEQRKVLSPEGTPAGATFETASGSKWIVEEWKEEEGRYIASLQKLDSKVKTKYIFDKDKEIKVKIAEVEEPRPPIPPKSVDVTVPIPTVPPAPQGDKKKPREKARKDKDAGWPLLSLDRLVRLQDEDPVKFLTRALLVGLATLLLPTQNSKEEE